MRQELSHACQPRIEYSCLEAIRPIELWLSLAQKPLGILAISN